MDVTLNNLRAICFKVVFTSILISYKVSCFFFLYLPTNNSAYDLDDYNSSDEECKGINVSKTRKIIGKTEPIEAEGEVSFLSMRAVTLKHKD